MSLTRRGAFSLAAAVLFLTLGLSAGCSEQPRTADKPPDPEAVFLARAGEHWELAQIGSQDIPSPRSGTPPDSLGRDLVPGRRPTIRFDTTTQRLGGRSFCNGYGGPYVLRGDSLKMTEIMGTAVGCDGPNTPEERFFRALGQMRRFEFRSDTLVLVGDDTTRLTFVRAATSPREP